MQIEDRLYALVAQARQQYGDAFLRDPAQLTPRLSSQAPDLYGEIRVLAALLAEDGAARIAAAPDPAAEEARLAAEIAGRERVSISVFAPALAVARRLGPLGAAVPSAAPAAGGWAGDSVVVGAPVAAAPVQAHAYAPQPPPHPAAGSFLTGKTELWKNRWIQVAAVGVALLVGYQFMQRGQDPQQPDVAQGPVPAPNPGPTPGPNPGPNPGPTPQPPAGGQQNMPVLAPPSGQIPTLGVQQMQNGAYGIGFTLPIQGGQVSGMVMLPPGGWQAGQTHIGFSRSPTGDLESVGAGTLQLVSSQNGLMRAMQPQWQQDNIGFGEICLAFFNGQNGQGQQQDVSLQGSVMCVMDSSCSRPAACGRVQ